MSLESDLWHLFDYDFRVKMASAMNRGLVGANKQVKEYAEALTYEEFGNPVDCEFEFERVANLMRDALLARYDETVEARKRVPSYQNAGGSRLPGVLRDVLKDPSMVVGNATGLHYLNVPLLNSAARHWRRLNFGAQPAAQHPMAPIPVLFDERVLFYAGSVAQARPAFRLPGGVFIDARTGETVPHGPGFRSSYSGSPPTVDRFFPGRSDFGGFGQTRGIEGRQFIDAGFEVLAEQFGPTVEGLVRKWVTQARSRLKSTTTDVEV